MPYIGIDFGTSNSVVADFQFGRPVVLPNHEGHSATPSVVTMRRDGSLAFGHEAKENFDEDRSIRSIKRVLGSASRVKLLGKELRPEQVAVMLLSLLKRDAEAVIKEPIQKAVVTVPANSKGLARRATKLCAGAAGLQVLTLINEPTAAAICYGLDAQTEQTILVYDFGGGTLDVTVLRAHHGVFEEVASKGVGKLGGDDLDAALGSYIAERFQQKTGYDILESPQRTPFLLAVERAKIALSGEAYTVAWAPGLVPDRQLSLEEPIERLEFERLIKPFVQQSGGAIEEALSRCGMTARDVDRVLLVGGSSKIPYVRSYVANKLDKEPEPFEKIDPMTCVAQGAAIVSAILQGATGLDHYAYSVKLEHSLCANPIDERGKSFLDPIIRRGTDIPCSFTKTYYPVADPAERIVVSVFEGDVYDDPDDTENVKLAEIPWEFDPPRPQHDAGIEVTYAYDDEGILTVQIHDPFTQARQRYAIQGETAEPLTPQQMEKMQAINEALVQKTAKFEASPQYRGALDVLNRAERAILPKIVEAHDRADIEAACRSLRQAMASGDLARMNELTGSLGDKLLNFAYLL
ncbi:MAG: Hsp70 family protein [Gemmataceae bacterium]